VASERHDPDRTALKTDQKLPTREPVQDGNLIATCLQRRAAGVSGR